MILFVMKDHIWFMKLAQEQAELAFKMGEVPVGCVVVDENQKVIAEAHNLKETVYNPCGHAELLAIKEASFQKKNWRLTGCSLYVTLEPCPMCLSACQQARFDNVYFGAYDAKGGALSLGYRFDKDNRLNHQFSVIGGVNHYKCSKLLSTFFKQRRKLYK